MIFFTWKRNVVLPIEFFVRFVREEWTWMICKNLREKSGQSAVMVKKGIVKIVPKKTLKIERVVMIVIFTVIF